MRHVRDGSRTHDARGGRRGPQRHQRVRAGRRHRLREQAAAPHHLQLVEQRAVPRDRYADLAAAACGRLKDKTGQVRKNALDLVVAVLAHNPFAPILDPAPHELRADALQAANVADHASIVLRDRARAEAVLAREEDDSVVLEEVDEAKEDALQIGRASCRERV